MRDSDDGLKKILRGGLPRFDIQPIEMDVMAPGVPDVNYCCDGVEGWIELKATSGWSVVVGEAQVPWIERRLRAGGRVYLAVRRRHPKGARREAVDELWLLAGRSIRALADYGLLGVDVPQVLGRWRGGPKAWNFVELAKLLCSVK